MCLSNFKEPKYLINQECNDFTLIFYDFNKVTLMILVTYFCVIQVKQYRRSKQLILLRSLIYVNLLASYVCSVFLTKFSNSINVQNVYLLVVDIIASFLETFDDFCQLFYHNFRAEMSNSCPDYIFKWQSTLNGKFSEEDSSITREH